MTTERVCDDPFGLANFTLVDEGSMRLGDVPGIKLNPEYFTEAGEYRLVKKLLLRDVDGPLANGRHRELEAEKVPRSAGDSAYYAVLLNARLMTKDEPVAGAADELSKLTAEGWHLVYLTSRNEREALAVTKAWLKEYGFPEGTLLLKPDSNKNDGKKSDSIKYVKTTQWKAAVAHALAMVLHPSEILIIENDQKVIAALEENLRGSGISFELRTGLVDTVEETEANEEERGETPLEIVNLEF